MKYRLKSYKTQICVKTVDINICESHSRNSVKQHFTIGFQKERVLG